MDFLKNVLDKYNKKSLFNYDSEVERDYCTLGDLVECNGIEAVYKVQALFINTKSRYGDAPVLVTNQWLVNAPKHLTDTVKAMCVDSDFVEAVNAGKVGFRVYQYTGKNGVGFSVEWTAAE